VVVGVEKWQANRLFNEQSKWPWYQCCLWSIRMLSLKYMNAFCMLN